MFSGPDYQGPRSDHYDGTRFHNLKPVETRQFGSFLAWMATRDQGPWQVVRDATPGPPPPLRVQEGDRLRVTFINHSTVLLQTAGLNILTDPIYSERCSPLTWAGPKRVRPPGIRFQDLPPIDVVLLSHNHYDHMDLPTLRRLDDAHAPRIYTGLGNRLYLEQNGIAGATDLDWWDDVALTDSVRLTCVPAQHFSNRGLFDRNTTLWAGFVLEAPGGPIYFAGDTGMGPHFDMIRNRFGRPRLALLPIGAFLPRWFMKPVHISPAEAVEVHRFLGAETSMAIHFGTFPLGDDGQHEPVRKLRHSMSREENPKPFWTLGFGEGRDVPRLSSEP